MNVMNSNCIGLNVGVLLLNLETFIIQLQMKVLEVFIQDADFQRSRY